MILPFNYDPQNLQKKELELLIRNGRKKEFWLSKSFFSRPRLFLIQVAVKKIYFVWSQYQILLDRLVFSKSRI